MKIKQIDAQSYLIRLDKGEKINAALQEFHNKYTKAYFCEIKGIGSVKDAVIGYAQHINGKTKYLFKEFLGTYELLSLVGNISLKNDESLSHVHVLLSDEDCHVIGGHLGEAIVAITAELTVKVYSTPISRFFDEEADIQILDI